jgi:hypothetical protein
LNKVLSLLGSVICSAAILFGTQGALAQSSKSASPPAPQMAVYRWPAPKGPAQVDTFATWIDQPGVWGEDFFAADTWDNIRDPQWLLGPWQDWLDKQEGRKVLLSVPMLPGAWDRSGPSKGTDAKKPVSLAAGAAGEYNQHFNELAKNLVERKMVDRSLVRLGWEFNGGWYTSRASDNPKAWAEYFRQIVKSMRGVEGAEKLQFCWNPTLGWQQFPAMQAYPGDDVVDVIGLDVYDESWAKDTYPFPKDATEDQILERQKRVWANVTYGGDHGLKRYVAFAAEHKKPIAICEWGVCDRADRHGGLDNPYFIEQMYKFITDPKNNVILHCYFDVEASDGKHQLSTGEKGTHKTIFPKSAAKFVELFGGPNAAEKKAK